MSNASANLPLLELRNLTRRFGGLVAVNDLTMAVMSGTIHGLIGPNGAGKSTAFDLISGLIPATDGDVILSGRSISGMPAEVRVAAAARPEAAAVAAQAGSARLAGSVPAARPVPPGPAWAPSGGRPARRAARESP